MALEGNQYLHSRGPWIPELGYLLRVRPERMAELKRELWAGSFCSEAVRKIPKLGRRKPILCLISTKRGLITHIGRAEVRHPAYTGWDKLDLWNLTPLSVPVRMSAIKDALRGRQTARARAVLKAGGHISSKTFDAVMEALKDADPAAFLVADGLINRDPPVAEVEGNPAQINWAFQRDAAVTALEIAGINKDLLEVEPQLDTSAARKISSIFDDLGDVISIEDNLILRDLDQGGHDWTYVRSHKYPARTFVSGETTLTLILANKLDLEVQLGVDLIYVNEQFGAVVFVQYKMLKGVDGEEGYRPDEQLDIEISRMDKAALALAKYAPDTSCDGYRLGSDPFFLKFCSKLLSHDSTSHVPGFYVPVSYWKRLALDPRVKGPRGGTIVHKETFGRYFSPTSFTDMVAKGWVGTSSVQYQALVEYLADAMRGKRGIVLAIESATPEMDGDDEVPPKRRKATRPRPAGQRAPTIQL